MKLNPTKNLSEVATLSNEVIKAKDCAKIKGGGYYYCCVRNKWIQY